MHFHQDQDVERDCVGWASYNKNFSFVREALEVMCSPEFNVTGVLVANKNKANTKACTIPSSCHGKIVQTTFLDQGRFFGYLSKVRNIYCFLFVKMLVVVVHLSHQHLFAGEVGIFATSM